MNNILHPQNLPQPLPDPLQINLGSGFDYRPGWVNVEANRGIKHDLLLNLETGSLTNHFPPNSVNLVLAQDILEHLIRPRALEICRQIYVVLAKGGTFIVRMPHLRLIVEAPIPLSRKIPLLYGGQDLDQGDHPAQALARKDHPEFFAHKYGWTPESFHKELVAIGFTGATTSVHWPNFILQTHKPQ